MIFIMIKVFNLQNFSFSLSQRLEGGQCKLKLLGKTKQKNKQAKSIKNGCSFFSLFLSQNYNQIYSLKKKIT